MHKQKKNEFVVSVADAQKDYNRRNKDSRRSVLLAKVRARFIYDALSARERSNHIQNIINGKESAI